MPSIRFRNDGSQSAADGSVGILVGTGAGMGALDVTYNGIAAFWIPDNAASKTSMNGIASHPHLAGGVVNTTGTPFRLEVHLAPGAYTMRMQTGLALAVGESYNTTGHRIFSSDGTTLLYAQTVGDVVADGDPSPSQINTDGSKQPVDAADAGVSITTDGVLILEVRAAGSWFSRLSYLSFTPVGATGPRVSVIRRRR